MQALLTGNQETGFLDVFNGMSVYARPDVMAAKSVAAFSSFIILPSAFEMSLVTGLRAERYESGRPRLQRLRYAGCYCFNPNSEVAGDRGAYEAMPECARLWAQQPASFKPRNISNHPPAPLCCGRGDRTPPTQKFNFGVRV
jgi:hypothetical protein